MEIASIGFRLFFIFLILNLSFVIIYHDALTEPNGSIYEPFTNHSKFDQKPVVEKKRKLIIISSMFRSGSSFLGSLFDKNPSFTYYFEPLSLFNEGPDKARVLLLNFSRK